MQLHANKKNKDWTGTVFAKLITWGNCEQFDKLEQGEQKKRNGGYENATTGFT